MGSRSRASCIATDARCAADCSYGLWTTRGPPTGNGGGLRSPLGEAGRFERGARIAGDAAKAGGREAIGDSETPPLRKRRGRGGGVRPGKLVALRQSSPSRLSPHSAHFQVISTPRAAARSRSSTAGRRAGVTIPEVLCRLAGFQPRRGCRLPSSQGRTSVAARPPEYRLPITRWHRPALCPIIFSTVTAMSPNMVTLPTSLSNLTSMVDPLDTHCASRARERMANVGHRAHSA